MSDVIIVPGGGSGSGGGGGSNASVGLTGTTAPNSATEVGFVSSGNLVAVSSSNPLPVTGGGGGTQYTDETAETAGAFTITAAGLYNGTDVVGLRGDASNNLYVNVHVALPAGTNIVGKFGIDQTTPGTTNGVQINAALPAGTNVIGHVIVDSGTVAATQSGAWNINQTLGTPGYEAITDGTNGPAAVKAASTAAGASDKALVVAISPNNAVSSAPAVSGTLTNRSGTITTGGTSQTLAATNSSRKYIIIQNPSTATESLFINFTTAASTSAGNSIELVPGGSYERTLATYMTTEQINVVAATTSHVFVAKEG